MSDDDYVKRSIFDLLLLDKTPLADTAEFQKMKHNNNLVPSFEAKLNQILDHFDRYRKISYDIQGIRDCGIDVVIKYEHELESRMIGLQIKSFDDFEKDAWTTKLKAQVVDAFNHYGTNNLIDFYLVFCTDIAKHKDKIRNATADLTNMIRFKVHIVKPEHALYFLRLREYSIAAYLKRKLSENDPVVVDAQDEIMGLSLAQSAMVIESACICISEARSELSSHEITRSSFVSEVYQKYSNISAEASESDWLALKDLSQGDITTHLIDDLQTLVHSGYLLLHSHSHQIHFDGRSYTALLCLIYEGIARLTLDRNEVKWYVFNLLKEDEITIARDFFHNRTH